MKIMSLQKSCPALSRLDRTVKNGARYRVRTPARIATRSVAGAVWPLLQTEPSLQIASAKSGLELKFSLTCCEL